MAAELAARPTKEWKAATVCGKDVGSTRFAIMFPAKPPTPIRPAIDAAVPKLGDRWPNVEATPKATPA